MSKLYAMLSATLCVVSLSADEGATDLVVPQEIALAPVESAPAEAVAIAAPVAVEVTTPFSPFTGKVKGKKVRLRVKADMDSHVIREVNKNELLSVIGEKGDFWAIQPPTGIKAYVFRSFILDNVVEGNRVNIRLEPSTEAPVIGHLNNGDKIQGTICAANNKWLEITPPAQTQFYIAKEYLENVGGPEVKAQADKRQMTAQQLFEAATLLGKAELRKSYDEMDIDRVSKNFKTIISEYTDFPELVEKAKEQLASLQESYLQKRLAQGESKVSTDSEFSNEVTKTAAPVEAATDRMKMWEPLEESLYLTWAPANEEKTLEQYYTEQKLTAVPITGILEAYATPVKNKPGDFIVRNKDLPVAYVYSTKVNLQNLVGKKVTLLSAPRPNNNFAFPAYFVLEAE